MLGREFLGTSGHGRERRHHQRHEEPGKACGQRPEAGHRDFPFFLFALIGALVPIMDLYPIGRPDIGTLAQPEEQPVFDHAGNVQKSGRKGFWRRNAAK